MSLTPCSDMKLDQIPPEYGEPVTAPLKTGEEDDVQGFYGGPPRAVFRASMREGHALNPQQVEFWSREDVCIWLCSLGRRYEIHQKAFYDLGIDGANLIHLTDEELKVEFQIRSSVERRKILISLRQLQGDMRMDLSPANSAGCTSCTRDRSSTNNSSRSRNSLSTYSNITPRGRSAGHQPSSVRSYSVPLGYAPDRISAPSAPPSAPHSRHGSQSRKNSIDSLADKTSGEWEARSMQRLFDRSPKHGDGVDKFEPKFAHLPARNIFEHQTISQSRDSIPVKRGSLRSTSRRRLVSSDFYHRQSSGSISLQSIASGISDIPPDHDEDPLRKQRINEEEMDRMQEKILQLTQEKQRLEDENQSLKQENQHLTSRKNSEPGPYLFDLRDPSIQQPNLDDEGFPLEMPKMTSASSLPITSTNVDDHLLERGRRASHTVDSVASETVTVTTNTSSDCSRKTSFSRCHSTSPRIANSAHFDYQKPVAQRPLSRDRITILNDRRPGWIRISWETEEGKKKTKWMSTTDFAKRFPPD